MSRTNGRLPVHMLKDENNPSNVTRVAVWYNVTNYHTQKSVKKLPSPEIPKGAVLRTDVPHAETTW